jgi:hypothetical protein
VWVGRIAFVSVEQVIQNDRYMADKHLKKIVAQTSAIVCMLAIAGLLLSLFASKYTPPLRYAANFLMTIAAGYNVYFLFNWLCSLA